MKVKFRGWGREVYPHNHNAAPVYVRNGKYRSGKAGEAIKWVSGMRALAKLSSLGLTGSFLVDIQFEPSELRNWITQYVHEEPELAARLLAEMQGEAMIALARKAKADAIDEAWNES